MALRKIIDGLIDGAEGLQPKLPTIKNANLDVTVFWGEADTVVRPDHEAIAQVGTLTELPRIGHIGHVEAMKDVNRFLKSKLGG